MTHVAILVHEDSSFSANALLAELASIWSESGIQVSVVTGIRQHVDAHALIVHVDLTRVPTEYQAFASIYPVVINGRVTDISKHFVSRQLVKSRRGYDGAVIVKTTWNFGGNSEHHASRQLGGIVGFATAARNRLPWSWRSRLDSYPVFESTSQVPLPVWLNRDLVVERFLPEKRDGLYCLRTWLFLGDRERMAIFFSKSPIVKSHNIIGRERLFDVPPELRQLRKELGFDFGKFDYVEVDGKPVLFDANRTPSLGTISRDDALPWLRDLAEGLHAFLPRQAT